MDGYNYGYQICAKKGDDAFKVHVFINWGKEQAGDRRMRVIVYGPHTLNKPTLDKPCLPLFLNVCQNSCVKDMGVWSFTGWKVPKGSDFKVCVWNQESGLDNCNWGRANSRSESIHVKAPH